MKTNSLHPAGEETVDEILGGRLRIIQRKRGYRFSLDALLLAHFVDLRGGDDLVDLGTGGGIIALILARCFCCGRIAGIEIQQDRASVAKRNVVLNRLAGRIEILQGDVRHPETLCAPQAFSAAVFNPPYRRLRSGRMNPDQEKATARHEIAGTVEDFLKAAAYLLRPGGRAYAIYPAVRMVELIAGMRTWRLEPKRLRIVHSHADGRGTFVLAEGVKGGREGLTVTPPMVIFQEAGRYTAETARAFSELSALAAHGGG